MAKYTKEQSEIHLKYISVDEIKSIASKHGYGWQTLYFILSGSRPHDIKRVERVAMIKEARELIKDRRTKDMEVEL